MSEPIDDAEEMPFPRPGLSASEAAIAWAMLRCGSAPQSADYLWGKSGERVHAIISELRDLDEEERVEVIELWRAQDRRWDRLDEHLNKIGSAGLKDLQTERHDGWANVWELISSGAAEPPWSGASPPTRRAIAWLATDHARAYLNDYRPELRAEIVPSDEITVETEELSVVTEFDLDALNALDDHRYRDRMRRLGVFYLAELSYNRSARELLRVHDRLNTSDRPWFERCLTGGERLTALERSRLRGFFNSLRELSGDMDRYLFVVAVCSVVGVLGQRDPRNLRQLTRQLSVEVGTRGEKYLQKTCPMDPEMLSLMQRMLDNYACEYQLWRFQGKIGDKEISELFEEELNALLEEDISLGSLDELEILSTPEDTKSQI